MFGFLKRLFRKDTHPPEPEGSGFFPYISVFVLPEGAIRATAGWPKPRSEEEFDRAVGHWSKMVHMLTTGGLRPLVLQAVSVAGERDDSRGTAQHILNRLDELRDGMEGPDDLVVPPTEVFNAPRETDHD